MLSTRSRVYRERQSEIDVMDDDALIAAMVEEPTLLRRPLIIAGDEVIVGFDRKRLDALVSSPGST